VNCGKILKVFEYIAQFQR